MPDTLQLQAAPVEIQAAQSEGKRPTFAMHGYTGSVMRLEGFGVPVVVDLSGIKVPFPKIPALRDHDTHKIIGQTDNVQIDASGVHITGTVTGDNHDAQEVVTQAKNGFAWKASIGSSIDRREVVAAGKTATVNGREVAGPCLVARESTLQEISFVSIGADSNTQVTVAAKKKGGSMDTETEVDPIQAERSRVKEIRLVCGTEHRDLEAQAIDEDWTIEATKANVLDTIRARRPTRTQGPSSGHRPIGSTKDRLTAALMMMGGNDALAVKSFGEQLVSGIQRPHSWNHVCAMALASEGMDVPHDKMIMVRAAFSTVSMPTALGESIEKIALQTFTDASENWKRLCRVVSATTFRAGSAIRLSPATKLQLLGPAGEIKHGDLKEDAFSFQVATYARMFTLTREAIINDDLGLLNDLPRVLGVESARTVSDLFFTSLTGNAGGYYGAPNGNLLTGNALSITGLSKAVATLRVRVDRDNRIIGFQPKTLLVPAALEQTARALLHSERLFRDQSTDSQPSGNPIADLNLDLAVEPRLDSTSTSNWYIFAPGELDAPTLVAFLQGVQGVHVESSMAEFDTLGFSYRAYMDVGVTLAESRATVKSTP